MVYLITSSFRYCYSIFLLLPCGYFCITKLYFFVLLCWEALKSTPSSIVTDSILLRILCHQGVLSIWIELETLHPMDFSFEEFKGSAVVTKFPKGVLYDIKAFPREISFKYLYQKFVQTISNHTSWINLTKLIF